MKYYKLVRDLPTFEEGEIFFIDGRGHLISRAHQNVVAYSGSTLAKFPNILKDWFVEVPDPVRDQKTKEAFIEYLDKHKDERFFQALRNFSKGYLGEEFNFIYSSKMPIDVSHDTFYLECDRIHELKEEEE